MERFESTTVLRKRLALWECERVRNDYGYAYAAEFAIQALGRELLVRGEPVENVAESHRAEPIK